MQKTTRGTRKAPAKAATAVKKAPARTARTAKTSTTRTTTRATKATKPVKAAEATKAAPKRNTRSGKKFEHVLTGIALRKHYVVRADETLPDPLFRNGTYRIDLLLETPRPVAPTRSRRAKPFATIGISAKNQNVSGSADEKLPAEILRLSGLVKSGVIDRGYLVLGGNGSKNFDLYLTGQSRVPGQDRISIINEADFRRLVNSHTL